jgi:hypothetical protein
MDGSEATLIGGASALIELARLRLLIDPPGDYHDRGPSDAHRHRRPVSYESPIRKLKRKERN